MCDGEGKARCATARRRIDFVVEELWSNMGLSSKRSLEQKSGLLSTMLDKYTLKGGNFVNKSKFSI